MKGSGQDIADVPSQLECHGFPDYKSHFQLLVPEPVGFSKRQVRNPISPGM